MQKSIDIITASTGEVDTVPVQAYGLEDNLVAVRVDIDSEDILTGLKTQAEIFGKELEKQGVALYNTANAAGLGCEYMQYLDELQVDHSAKIPKIFTGELRKQIGQYASRLRMLTDPVNQPIVTSIYKTSVGYWMEVTAFGGECVVLGALVTPVYADWSEPEKVLEIEESAEVTDVQPAMQELVEVVCATEDLPAVFDQGGSLSQDRFVTLIHPSAKPEVVGRCKTPYAWGLQYACRNAGTIAFF